MNNLKNILLEKLKTTDSRAISTTLKITNPNLIPQIYEKTPYLSDTCKLTERIYHIVNDLQDYPKCSCGNNRTNFISFNQGYKKFCSPTCAAKYAAKTYWDNVTDKQTILRNEKIIISKLKKYGNKMGNISKLQRTKLIKYGDANYCNPEKIKNTKLMKHGNENYNNREKFIEAYHAKTKKELVEINRRVKNTKFKKYGDENYNNREKFKQTLFCNPEKEKKRVAKIRKTRMSAFYKNLFLSSRLKNLVSPQFDITTYSGVTERKSYPFLCKKCGNIFKDHLDDGHIPRCFDCFPPLPSGGFVNHTGYYRGFLYQSNWELSFIKFCLKNDISIQRNKKGFTYWYQDKKHKYYPDFYLPEVDQYVEIKGYIREPEKEKEKWIQFPYKLDIYRIEKMYPILKEIE